MSSRHDWCSWTQYSDIHSRCLHNFEHFILNDLLMADMTPAGVAWGGELFCQGGIEIHVHKLQDVRYDRDWAEVRTHSYSYHVLQRRGSATVSLFRYDNIHVHAGHPDAHHRHRFDKRGGEIEPAKHVGEANWPTLGEVLQEANEWWLRWCGEQRDAECE